MRKTVESATPGRGLQIALGLSPGIRQLRDLDWRDLLAFRRPRWEQLAPGRAARIALGVAAPLLIGLATGHLEAGIFAALGALPAGVVSFQGVTKSRLDAVLAASIGMAVSTFLGAVMAGTGALTAVPVALWAYFTGLSIALGNRASVVVLNWTVSLLIGLSLPLAPGPAAARAGLVLAGGLFQGLLVVISWVFRPGAREREAIAATYSALAGYASSLAAGRVETPSSSAFPATGALEDPNPLLPAAVRVVYLDLLEDAVRIRASLAALAVYLSDPAESESLHDLTREAGSSLDQIARGLGAPPREWARWVEGTRQSVAALKAPPDARWRWAGEALFGQLRSVTRILIHLDQAAGVQVTPRSADPAFLQTGRFLSAALGTLRANATLRAEAGRHAVRLALAAGVAELVGSLARLHYARWAVLTVLLVLKPDYASTVTRSVQRAVGTLLGAVLALAFIGLVEPTTAGKSFGAVVVIALAYVMFESNYAAYSLFLTAFVVLLLDLLGLGPLAAAEARLGATAAGAVWAMVVYLAWPTWAGGSAPEIFAVLIDRVGACLGTLLTQLAHPDLLDVPRLRREQDAARRARSDAEAATERLAHEPPQPPLTAEVARGLMAVFARLARGLLAAQTLVEHRGGTRMSEVRAARLDALASAFRSAMGQLASSLRGQDPPGPLLPLRQLQVALCELGESDPSELLVTDALVDAVGSLGALLDPGHGAPAGVIAAAQMAKAP